MSNARYYLLNCKKQCSEKCNYCPGLGFRTENKDDEAIAESLLKAKTGRYNKVILPCNVALDQSTKLSVDQIIETIRDQKFTPVVMLNTKYLKNNWIPVLEDWHNKWKVEFLILIDHLDDEELYLLNDLEARNWPIKYFVVLHKNQDIEKMLNGLTTEMKERTYLYAPYKLNSDEPYLTTRNLYKNLKKIQQMGERVYHNHLEGFDVFDPRIESGSNLEVFFTPSFEFSAGESNIKASVIIPSFNNKNYLVNTVQHLFEQDLDFRKYEVIVVDDGSTDGSQEELQKVFANYKDQRNFKYVYFPRKKPRYMGDNQFRAGIARNLGAKHAAGELLVFLDSDILTPKNYLTKLLSEHESYDVVQTERIYLTKKSSHRQTNYSQVDAKKESYIPENGYWEKFYRNTTDWNLIPFGWKYVCTYGLSLKKELFMEVGWFSKNYIFYGFEDTDLGYRLFKLGAKFHKSTLKVLHLFHENQKSEFQNSDYLRQALLKKTAKIFFHNRLDPIIFENMRSLVDDGVNIYEVAVRMRSKFFGTTIEQ